MNGGIGLEREFCPSQLYPLGKIKEMTACLGAVSLLLLLLHRYTQDANKIIASENYTFLVTVKMK